MVESATLTLDEVMEALRDVYDPEIPINVVDLGLVYDVNVDGNDVDIRMTLTFAGCGMGPYIAQQAEWRLAELENIEDVTILTRRPPLHRLTIRWANFWAEICKRAGLTATLSPLCGDGSITMSIACTMPLSYRMSNEDVRDGFCHAPSALRRGGTMVGQATFSGLRIGARSVKDRTIRSVRSRLHFLRSMRIGVMLFTISSMTQCNLTQENRPNFIFILSDDQGWTGSSVQMDSSGTEARSDYYETPNLDRLARQGMRFSNGYSPASICTPSRRSIQFGQTPARQRGTLFESDFEPKGKLSIPLMLKSISPDS